jgi:hypothetical protein
MRTIWTKTTAIEQDSRAFFERRIAAVTVTQQQETQWREVSQWGSKSNEKENGAPAGSDATWTGSRKGVFVERKHHKPPLSLKNNTAGVCESEDMNRTRKLGTGRESRVSWQTL